MVIPLQQILSHDKDRVEDDDVSTVAVRLGLAAPIGT